MRRMSCIGCACLCLLLNACAGNGTPRDSGLPEDGANADSGDQPADADGGTLPGDEDGDAGSDAPADTGEDAGDAGGGPGDPADGGGDGLDAGLDGADTVADGADAGADGADAGGDDSPGSFVAVTFNTGIHPTVGTNGFTAQQNEYLDTYYGHGLCWGPAIDEARAFFDSVQPDVVCFQELFDIEECESIPPEAREGFVCENWTPDSPTVAELILGPNYQLACNWHKHDKCAAVRTSFGTFEGCSAETCMDGLFGSTIDGCSQGARIGRGVIELSAGGTLTLVNVHGSSGVSGDDIDCRVQQVEQVFVDLGDGEPAANCLPNLIMGDFNTDPRSAAAVLADASARRWNDFVGADLAFDFVNEHVATYHNLFCIDNIVSDELTGSCWYPGFSNGHPAVSEDDNFDHTPTVCIINLQ